MPLKLKLIFFLARGLNGLDGFTGIFFEIEIVIDIVIAFFWNADWTDWTDLRGFFLKLRLLLILLFFGTRIERIYTDFLEIVILIEIEIVIVIEIVIKIEIGCLREGQQWKPRSEAGALAEAERGVGTDCPTAF